MFHSTNPTGALQKMAVYGRGAQRRFECWRRTLPQSSHRAHPERSIVTGTCAPTDRDRSGTLKQTKKAIFTRFEQHKPFSTTTRKPMQSVQADKPATKARDKVLVDQWLNQSSALMDQIKQLPRLEPIWHQQQNTATNYVDTTRQAIFREAQTIVQSIEQNIKAGGTMPSQKYQPEYLVILERVLYVYSQSSLQIGESVYAHLMDLLKLMKEWELDPRQGHIDHMLTIAAREGFWKEAADFFWSNIDPEVSGYSPVTVSVSNPIGLYVIARAAQASGAAVVESVMDSVLRMSMVSPMDQEKYVLAAGTAIGLVGEADALINYLKTSYNASQLGQPLIAAVMQSCILSEMYDQAVDVFEESVGANGDKGREWQWGGGEDLLHPSCRDLIMRALGGCSHRDAAQRALQFFTETIQEGVPISISAVHGVVKSCEQAGLWENAISVLILILDLQDMLVGKDYFPFRDSEASGNLSSDVEYEDFVSVIDSVMRSCNTAHQFGTALLCLRLAGWKLFGAGDESIQFILGIPQPLWRSPSLLATTSVALCGVHRPDTARNIFDVVTADDEFVLDSNSRRLYEFLISESSKYALQALIHPWDVVDKEIQRCLLLLGKLEANATNNRDRDMLRLSQVLSSAVRSCTAAEQPIAGLCFGKWIESQCGTHLFDGLFTDAVLDKNENTLLSWPDSLVAATIEANRAAKNFEVAENLVQSYVISSISKPILSTNQAIKLLAERNHHEAALSLFQQILVQTKNPDLFATAAQVFTRKTEWSNVSEIYGLASSSGCVSEELAMLAMQSTVAGKQDGWLLDLRSIAGEVAHHTGMAQPAWLSSKYWQLKKSLGFRVMCSLFYWNDEKCNPMDELELALRQLESRTNAGMTPKNDVLRTIVFAATKMGDVLIHPARYRVPRVPKSREERVAMLMKALELAKETKLISDFHFVRGAVTALLRLDCHDACLDFVKSAIDRGVRMPPSLIGKCLAAQYASGSVNVPADLELLSQDDYSVSTDSARDFN